MNKKIALVAVSFILVGMTLGFAHGFWGAPFPANPPAAGRMGDSGMNNIRDMNCIRDMNADRGFAKIRDFNRGGFWAKAPDFNAGNRPGWGNGRIGLNANDLDASSAKEKLGLPESASFEELMGSIGIWAEENRALLGLWMRGPFLGDGKGRGFPAGYSK